MSLGSNHVPRALAPPAAYSPVLHGPPRPVIAAPARPAKRAKPSKAPDDMELLRRMAPAPDSNANDFDQAPIFTGKPKAPSDGEPTRAAKKPRTSPDDSRISPFP